MPLFEQSQQSQQRLCTHWLPKRQLMIRRKLLAAAITAAIAAPATAGVQTMTSDEMVETYVEDSAVIVVPKDQQKSEADRQRIIQALTISPGEPRSEERRVGKECRARGPREPYNTNA